jgi:hypothetical protein
MLDNATRNDTAVEAITKELRHRGVTRTIKKHGSGVLDTLSTW